MYDEVLLRVSAICYACVISFVPTLITAMLIGARFLDLEKWFLFIRTFMWDNNIPIDPTPFFQVINDFLKNATAIGGVGLFLSLFSATALLRNLEGSLNKIWDVKKQRPFIQKIFGFIMVIILAPVLIGTIFSLLKGSLAQFSVPDFKSVYVNPKGKTYILGSNSHLMSLGHAPIYLTSLNVLEKIDFDYNLQTFIVSENSTKLTLKAKNTHKTIDKDYLNSSDFTDISQVGKVTLIITSKGLLLKSSNFGDIFYIQQFLRSRASGSYASTNEKPIFLKQIYMLNEKQGFLIGDSGLLLQTQDAGEHWKIIPIATKWELNEIHTLADGRFLLIGDKHKVFISDDGLDWKPWTSLLTVSHATNVDFLDIDHYSDFIIIVGNSGHLFISQDGGSRWEICSLSSRVHIYSVSLISENSALIVGSGGRARYTRDGGKHWKKINGLGSTNFYKTLYNKSEKKTYIVGEEGSLLISKANSLSDFYVVQEHLFATHNLFDKFVVGLLLPFLLIWLFFFLIYKIIPYENISTKAASVAAGFASFAWVLFLLGFKIYISSFSKGTFIIYGSLGAIPLFLIWFYISIVILLLGVEISYFVQNPQEIPIYLKSRRSIISNELYYALEVLSKIYINFSKGKGATPEVDLLREQAKRHDLLPPLLKKLQKAGFIERIREEAYLPLVESKYIVLKNILDLMDSQAYKIPHYNPQNRFMKNVENHFKNLRKYEKKQLSNIRLHELLNGCI